MIEKHSKIVATALLTALRRLQEGNPSHPALIAANAQGKLKISFSSVATEAGVSRSLIGYDGCAYMEIRTLIAEAIGETEKSRFAAEAFLMEQEIQNLRKMIIERDSINAELVLRARAYERGLHSLDVSSASRRASLQIVGISDATYKSEPDL